MNELQNRRLHEIEILNVDLSRIQARPGARDTNPLTLPKRQIETIILPPLAATMDDCCRIADMLPAPSGETPLTIAILSIASPLELSVSAVYTANPLNGDGVSIDVEYIPSRRLVIGGDG